MNKILKQITDCISRLRIRKHNSKFSKKTYNNWVHIVLLTLRQTMDKSYREFCDIIYVYTEILTLLGITQVSHFTTLQRSAKRLRVAFLEKIMAGFILFSITVNVRTGIDATGLQPTMSSAHYTTIIKNNRKNRRRIKRYIKLTTYVERES